MKWTHALKDFEHYLQIERGLSKNTLESYRLDVNKLIAYLESNLITTGPIEINNDTIKRFVYELAKTVNSRTQSRVISGLRSFFDYLIFENYRKTNPLEQIETPRIGRKLPNTLALKEIDLMVAAIDLTNPLGERNRAIIETLYSCGLRVSELTDLKISDLFFKEGFIKVTGKGNKQRFVPIGLNTQKFIKLYIHHKRSLLNIASEYMDTLFLNQRGKKLTRAMIFTIVKKLAKKVGFSPYI